MTEENGLPSHESITGNLPGAKDGLLSGLGHLFLCSRTGYHTDLRGPCEDKSLQNGPLALI